MSTGMTLPFFLEQFTDNAGRPLSGGSLTFLVAGSTSLPKPIYLDIALQNEAPNPLPLDGSGRAPQYFAEAGAYKVVVKASTGTIEATRDYVEGVGGSGNIEDHKVATSALDENAGYLVDKLVGSSRILVKEFFDYGTSQRKIGIALGSLDGIPPSGPAGGDLHGTYPDPIVEQLTGVAASLLPIASDFTTTTTPKNTAIAFGKQYFAGVEVPCWMATDFAGNIRWTRDEWATTVADAGLALRGIGTNWNCARFLYLPAFASWAWVLGDGSHRALYYALHGPSAYNANGTIKSAQWTMMAIPNGPANIGDIAQGLDNVICTAGYSNIIGRTADFATFTEFVPPDGFAKGGIDTDTYGNWLVIARDTGKIFESTDNGLTWTHKAAIFLDGSTSSVPNLPTTGGAQWGSIAYGYGTWLAAVYNASSTTPTYAYSYDRLNWFIYYAGTSESFFSSAFNGVKWFATNPSAGNPIWQLLVAEIPAHKKLIAEKGLVVAGQTFLPDLASAQALGTDKNGLLSRRDSLALAGNIMCLNLVANGNIATQMVNTQSYQVNGTETIDSARNVKAATLWSGGAIRVDANGDFSGRNQTLTGWLTLDGATRPAWGGGWKTLTIGPKTTVGEINNITHIFSGLYDDGAGPKSLAPGVYPTIAIINGVTGGFDLYSTTTPTGAYGSSVVGLALKMSVNRHGGFGAFGVIPPTTRPTITGQRTATATLAALYAALSATGLILDSTTGSSVQREFPMQNLPITNSAPAVVTVVNANMKGYGFSGTGPAEEMFYDVDLQHDYIAGTDIVFHIHWAPATGTGGNVKWQLYYQWTENGAVVQVPTLVSVVTAANTTALTNTVSAITISGAGHTYQSILNFRLFRDSTDAADTYAGTAIMLSRGTHYQSDPGQA